MKKSMGWLLILISLFISGCSGIKLLSGSRSDLYSEKFLQKINEVKSNYKIGNSDKAMSLLNNIDEQVLLPTERALRRNLIGVIFFSKNNYEQSIFNFEQALSTSRLDEGLTAQIYLNLSSSYFKLGFLEKSYQSLITGNPKSLSPAEAKKYYKLRFKLAQDLSKDRDMILSLFNYLGDIKGISSLKIDPHYELLMSKYLKLERNEKFKLLEEFEKEKYLIIGYLAYLEAEKVHYSGEKDEAKDILGWISKYFSEHEDLTKLVQNFSNRVENYAQMQLYNIGVVLPLSGDKKQYGQRALLGIDSALREAKERLGQDLPYKIYTRDSVGSPVMGARSVKDLIETYGVSVIIGGLFSTEAAREYEEARARGVMFISLSQIFVNKESKDHLLLEVPGSIESQVNQLLSDDFLKKFGTKGAVIYPKGQRGESYVNELWRKSKLKGVEISDVVSYEEKQSDFRDPVKNLLGLKFRRVRQEEYDMMEEIHALEKSSSIRRIQTLKPQTNFDWVFIPAYPLEAIQIIPSFTFYDAFNVKVVGGPSWRSRSLSRESYKFKNIYFVGDDVASVSEDFTKWFNEKYGQAPKLIEMRAFDAVKIFFGMLDKANLTTRNDLDTHVRGLGQITGLTGKWLLTDGVWIKEMTSLNLRNGKIKNILVPDEEGVATESDATSEKTE